MQNRECKMQNGRKRRISFCILHSRFCILHYILRQRLAMRIAGERLRRTRLIQTERYVVAVEVELVIPADDPSEPCYEAETVNLLREIKEHAERDELSWLKQHGKVYAAIGAA